MDNISPDEKPLNLKDLALLMEAYKNNIELSTMLHEQNKQILDQQEKIINSIGFTCSTLNSCFDKIQNTFREIGSDLREHDKSLLTTSNSYGLSLSEKYNTLKAMIYVAYGGLGAIIVALLGIIINLIK